MATSGTVPVESLNYLGEEKSSRSGNKDTLLLIFRNPCLWRGFLFVHQDGACHFVLLR